MKTPIAVFTYKRARHTQECLEALSNCRRLQECSLHIYCDGPKPGDEAAVEETRGLVHAWREKNPALEIEITERQENLGLSRSIVAGVSQLCDAFGRVIVVEDDLILGHSFIDTMLQCLDHYQDEERVAHIGAYMWPTYYEPGHSVFLAPFATSWGWATWKRAWKYFDWNPSGCEKLSDLFTRWSFDMDGANLLTEMLFDRLAGRNDSWAVLWNWATFQNGLLTVHPKHSLVWNAGMDGSGVHTGNNPNFRQMPRSQVLEYTFGERISFPTEVTIDEQAFARLKSYLIYDSGPERIERLLGYVNELKELVKINNPNALLENYREKELLLTIQNLKQQCEETQKENHALQAQVQKYQDSLVYKIARKLRLDQ